jgi:hypothetical protein
MAASTLGPGGYSMVPQMQLHGQAGSSTRSGPFANGKMSVDDEDDAAFLNLQYRRLYKEHSELKSLYAVLEGELKAERYVYFIYHLFSQTYRLMIQSAHQPAPEDAR